MPEEFSPEEKLLRLIRGDKKQQPKPVVNNAQTPVNTAQAKPAAPLAVKYERRGERGRLKIVNLALIALLVSAILFLVYDLVGSNLKAPISGVQHKTKIKKDEIPAPVSRKAQDSASQAQVTPFSSYQEVVGKRELFKPLRTETPAAKTPKPATDSGYDKLKDLSLIGIVAGEKPQAIIEDRKIQKTYFLNKGQTVNQLTVEDILKDRVILDFEGEKLELVL